MTKYVLEIDSQTTTRVEIEAANMTSALGIAENLVNDIRLGRLVAASTTADRHFSGVRLTQK